MRLKSVWIFFIFCFIVLNYNNLQAKHIIGGDVTYTCMGIDTISNTATYKIVFTMYRDCQGGGAQFDSDAQIGVYRSNGGTFQWIETLTQNFDETKFLQPTASPCVEIPANICVEEGKYVFEITLPIINFDYMLTYQRCCRNVTIANIVNAEDTGASYSIRISKEAQKICNSSPYFTEFPPIVICEGEPLFASQAAVDPDGDLLVYEFCSPKQGGGPFGSNENPGDAGACNGIIPNPMNCPPPLENVIFKLPIFSANNPVSGDPRIVIDSETGLISGTPNLKGQFVVGVCIKEYRNGVLLGEINRDFQFNVTECDAKVNAKIVHDAQIGPSEYLVNSCGDFKIAFLNESEDPDFIDTYLWEFNIGANVVKSNDKDVEITFPGLGNYTGRMIINPDAIDAECTDTAFFEVNVYPDIEADFRYEYDTCIAGPVNFTDLSISGAGSILFWDWDFDDGNFSPIKNPNHLYRVPGAKDVKLIVTDVNECKDSLIQTFQYAPAPPIIIIEPSSFFGCTPANIFFNNLSIPIDSTYDILWDFGDGTTSTEISPTHVYEETGVFDVSLEIVSPIGCGIAKDFSSLIEVESKPEADFMFSPEEPTSLNRTVRFSDKSTNAVKWIWEFGDEGAAFEPNPNFTFRDTGIHEIQLVVFHPSGCPDTMIQIIDIAPVVTYFMPNAFSPNADGKNDIFVGKGITSGMRSFEMNIYNRWGEMVFESSDPYEGWNGQKNNVGQAAQNGVYVYKIRYVDSRGNVVSEDGFATLIR